MDELKQALKYTLKQLTLQMTNQVRRNAVADGWEQDVASSLSVVSNGTDISIHVDDQFANQAFVHEFGDQNNSPKATLRKFGHQDASAEETAVILFNKFLDKKL